MLFLFLIEYVVIMIIVLSLLPIHQSSLTAEKCFSKVTLKLSCRDAEKSLVVVAHRGDLNTSKISTTCPE